MLESKYRCSTPTLIPIKTILRFEVADRQDVDTRYSTDMSSLEAVSTTCSFLALALSVAAKSLLLGRFLVRSAAASQKSRLG
jgi:hypothetical protein